MRYLMTFSYDGTNYNGYQIQTGKKTIQGELEQKLMKINGMKEVKIHSSGRTDAHVHAICQKAHFDLDKEIDINKFIHSLNSILENDIYVKNIEKVNDDFHARYCVLEKEYIYKINIGEYNPFDRNYIYQYNKKLDIEKMCDAIKFFIGNHNFKSFAKIDKDDDKDLTRTIYEASIEQKDNIVTIKFKGSGFLRYMVRNMVGTLIEVGEGKINPKDIIDILDKENRIYAGKTAIPNGLYLNDVKYK